jgi:hypothetical protein
MSFRKCREHGQSWAEEIRRECVVLSKTALPKSVLGQAAAYTLNMWVKLRRCFDYVEVELSNNLAENSMRPIALGRKNWLHVGSAQAGPKVAAILSAVESCRTLQVPVKDYLMAILPGMQQRKLSEVANLTPARLGCVPRLIFNLGWSDAYMPARQSGAATVGVVLAQCAASRIRSASVVGSNPHI